MAVRCVLFDVGGTLIVDNVEDRKAQALPIRGTINTVKLLSEEFVLAVVSNVPKGLNKTIKAVLIEAGFNQSWFKAIIASNDPGMKEKPDRSMFLFAMKKVGADMSSTVMVGNTLKTDILGANLVGIKSIFIDYNGSYIHRPIDDPKPSVIISNIEDLPDTLKRI
jgi:putative hydrolase of the HAD superfamily